MTKIKVGDLYESNNCGWFEVIEYNSCSDIKVRFIDTGYTTNARGDHIRKGTVKDKLYPTVYGVGFIGEGEYKCKVDGKTTKAYDCWSSMLERCYSEGYQEKRPTYRYCSAHVDWHNFQIFAKYYEDNYRELYQLDKDLLFKGNKVYSPKTCIFVPPPLNSFTIGRGNARGKYKVGVYLREDRSKLKPYNSQISNHKGKTIYLGNYETEDGAYQAWLTAKLQQALGYKPEMAAIDKRIYPNVVEIIKEM